MDNVMYSSPAGPKTRIRQKAERILSYTFRGAHHVHGKIREIGRHCVEVSHNPGLGMATWNNDQLVRLVLMAHVEHVRVSVSALSPTHIMLRLFERKPLADAGDLPLAEGHPGVCALFAQVGDFLREAVPECQCGAFVEACPAHAPSGKEGSTWRPVDSGCGVCGALIICCNDGTLRRERLQLRPRCAAHCDHTQDARGPRVPGAADKGREGR